MNRISRRPGSIALILCVLALAASCCTSKNGENGQTDGESRPASNGKPAELPRNYPRTIDAAYPYPAGAAVGEWVERRTTERHGATWTGRLAVVGQEEGEALWIEETDTRTVPGHTLVRRRLVSPDGTVREGWIGYAGEKGEPLELVPAPPFFEGEPDGEEEAQVSVPAGTFTARVQIFGSGPDAERIYVSSEVPYDHVVKREDAESVTELLKFGKDAKPQLAPSD